MTFILGILLSALAFVVGAKAMNSVDVKDFWSAIIVALVMSFLSATLGLIMNFFTAPINWLTLGLFSFFVDAVLILVASKLLDGFHVRSFWSALVLAFIVFVVNWFTHSFFGL